MVHLRRLRRCRMEAALTQGELAALAGLSPRSVARIERGETEPHASTIRKLARTLGREPLELMGPDLDDGSSPSATSS